MMDKRRHSILLLVSGAVVALLGLVLVVGGAWLIALGGSWYYLLAGLGLAATGGLLAVARPAALWAYAAVLAGTLLWSLWEVGLDWWPLAARGGVIFLIGLFLLTPWVTRRLEAVSDRRRLARIGTGADRESRGRSLSRVGLRGAGLFGSGLPLAVIVVVSLGVAVASWFADPHRIEGLAPAARAAVPPDAQGVAPEEWRVYGRTEYGQRYSPLDQITPANVAGLEEVWTYRTGDIRGEPWEPEETTFQVTPLKIGDLLFLCTPHQSVIALDAVTGEEVWRYFPEIQGELALQHLTCRGLTYHERAADPVTGEIPARPTGVTLPPALLPGRTETGQPVAARERETVADCPAKLFMPTADARLIALDPATGAVCAGFGGGAGQIDLWQNMPYVNPGAYYSTSPVVTTRDLVIVGGTVLDNVSTTEPSGVIRAFDVETGVLVWNWDSGDPERTEPLPPGETYTPNSPNSWSISSLDEELGLIYVPMGNAPPDQYGGDRTEAMERFSSSIVALDIETGAVRWYFRTVNHDLWDYDVPSQPSLVDLSIGGEMVPALVQATKQGDVYVLDRRDGTPVIPVSEIAAPGGAVEGDWTAETQPVSGLSWAPAPLTGADMWGATIFDQLACRIAFHQLRYEGMYTPPSLEGTLVHPGNFGVFNWGSIAVDPERQVAFTTPAYLAFVSRLIPRDDDETLYVQDEEPPGALPALNENFGAPYAVELYAFTSPLGLPCEAPPWGYVALADLVTGEVIWQHKNGTVRDLSPIPLPLEMGVPSLGGPLLTGGGLAFLSGTLDYYIRAYDVADGAILWESRLPAGGQATPMTYVGADGRQYIVVAAGGHGSLGTKAGDHVIAYALPE